MALAVLTTFDFDMDSFRAEAGEEKDNYIVFRGDGLYQNKDNETAGIVQISFPSDESKWPERYFHPKVSIYRYFKENSRPLYRLRIGSKNLYPFDNIETSVCFEGQRAEKTIEKNRPLIDFLAFLIRALPDGSSKKGQLQQLAEEIEQVDFRLLPPFGSEQYEFVFQGIDRSPMFEGGFDELLVLSPSIDIDELKRISASAGPNARIAVVSKPATLLDLVDKDASNIELLNLPLDKYLHAKLYLLRFGNRFDLFLGSMNLTRFAVHKNVEAMVYLRDVKGIESTTSFLSDFLHIPKAKIEKERGQYIKIDPKCSFLEAASSMENRLNHLSRVLHRDKERERREGLAFLLTSDAAEAINAMIVDEDRSFLPTKKMIPSSKGKRTVFFLPEVDNILLGAINHCLHRYDYLFRKEVYLHVLNRGISDVFKSIRNCENFGAMHLFRTDIHAFDSSMDRDEMLRQIDELFAFDDKLRSFLKRYIAFSDYEEGGVIHHDGPAQYTGLPLAGFLENIYLRELDNAIAEQADFYARCSDDILIGSFSAEKIANLACMTKDLLSQKKLSVSETKTFFINGGEPFVFLGWKIEKGKIDFSDDYLRALKRSVSGYARHLLRLNKKGYSLRSVVKLANRFIGQMDLRSCFNIISQANGLKAIDGFTYDFIRVLSTGNRGKAKYRISHQEIRESGYKSLVNAYYRYLKDKSA